MGYQPHDGLVMKWVWFRQASNMAAAGKISSGGGRGPFVIGLVVSFDGFRRVFDQSKACFLGPVLYGHFPHSQRASLSFTSSFFGKSEGCLFPSRIETLVPSLSFKDSPQSILFAETFNVCSIPCCDEAVRLVYQWFHGSPDPCFSGRYTDITRRLSALRVPLLVTRLSVRVAAADIPTWPAEARRSAPHYSLPGSRSVLQRQIYWHNPPEHGAPRLQDPCSEYFPSNEGELHHTVWRTWLFIAYSDEGWLYSPTLLYISP